MGIFGPIDTFIHARLKKERKRQEKRVRQIQTRVDAQEQEVSRAGSLAELTRQKRVAAQSLVRATPTQVGGTGLGGLLSPSGQLSKGVLLGGDFPLLEDERLG